MPNKLVRKLLVALTFLYLFLFLIKPRLPGISQIQKPVLSGEPIQNEMNIPEIKIEYDNYTYEIIPLYSYEIAGLVVEEYSSRNLLDITHKNDPANTKDLCLVWGENVKSGAYNKVRYSHGEFTCYYHYSKEINPPFKGSMFSNNHLLPKNKDIEKMMNNSQIGDQIIIKGYLANYKIYDREEKQISERHTSTIRDDTGNGACEIIYVNEIEVLKKGNLMYFTLKKYLPFLIFSGFIFLIFFNRNNKY